MKLDKVTITGADRSQDKDVYRLIDRMAMAYPFVEWGILVTSDGGNGSPRFPDYAWISDCMEITSPGVSFSMHVCGRHVRDMCKGEPSFLDIIPEHYFQAFSRIQLNFSCYMHLIDRDRMLRAMLIPELAKKQFILQFSEPDYELLKFLQDGGVDVVPFFDRSGGRGDVPENWPKHPGQYCGYAGGLTPENVDAELKKISNVVGQDERLWIDVETGVRSEKNIFDFRKVESFLKACKPWIDPEALKKVYSCCLCGWSGKDIVVPEKEELERIETELFGGLGRSGEGLCPQCNALFIEGHPNPYMQREEEQSDDDWLDEDEEW